MSNPLDNNWQSYKVLQDAINVVRRTLVLGGAMPSTLDNSQFVGLPDATSLKLLDDAEENAGYQTILFMYATFESTLRSHLESQAAHLAAAQTPDVQFGVELQSWFKQLCRSVRMDGVTNLFKSVVVAVNPDLISVIGTIRTYRNWLAHGRQGKEPPAVTPLFTYESLTQFLQACGLI